MRAAFVSVIIPLYRSAATLPACLDALAAQTFTEFEVILVDSSPTDEARAIARSYPKAQYVHSERRLLAQAARNVGAGKARGPLLMFADPDVYLGPRCLAELVQTQQARSSIVFGPIACHGRRWLDIGVHFAKFSASLPGREARPVQFGWSGNVLMDQTVFNELGGWEESRTQGDTVFGARARAAGYEMWLEPEAVAFHDHEQVSLSELVSERYRRGREFAHMESSGELCGPPRSCAGVLLLPLRLLSRAWRVTRSAAESGSLVDLIWTSPIVAVGLVSWYAGLAAGMLGLNRLRE